jgi:hypothetical protein
MCGSCMQSVGVYRSARRSVSSGLAVGREPLGSPCDTLPKLPSVSPAGVSLEVRQHAHLVCTPSTSHTSHGFRQSSVAVQAPPYSRDAILATSIEARSMTWRSCRILTPMLASAVASSLDDDVLRVLPAVVSPQSPRMATVVLLLAVWLPMLRGGSGNTG